MYGVKEKEEELKRRIEERMGIREERRRLR